MKSSKGHGYLKMKLQLLSVFASLVFLGLMTLSLLNSEFQGNPAFGIDGRIAIPKMPKMLLKMDLEGEVHDGKSQVYSLKGLKEGSTYSLSLSVESPRQFDDQDVLRVTLADAQREITAKPLHLGDPDLYVMFRPSSSGDGKIMVAPNQPRDCRYQVTVLEWPRTENERAALEAEPNDSWQEANPIVLGRTIFGTADDHPYIPLQGTSKRQAVEGNEDWFRFEFNEALPKLVFFELDLMERDNIPVDVAVFTVADRSPKAYQEGMDPVTPPHEVQALSGNKFTTAVFKEKGTYYVRVKANHPFYQLRTSVYDVPPYRDPRQAVRAGVDYIISAGDSWHANTPRKGAIYDRISNVHQETSLCVACHPTHFSQRAQLYAVQNGYPVRDRPQLQFLAERFYNNPRPFYGHPGATWSRVISAPANVLGRMAALLNIYEREVTGEHRPKMFEGVANYLRLYYKGRTELPPDETNGNTPLISTYEVAWYSWIALDEQYRRSGDGSFAETRDLVRRLIEQTQHKNMLDLCFQTLALSTIDRDAYAKRIRQNSLAILSYQRPSGQWTLSFEKDAPEAEFQTGACLWTLAVAGYPASHPQIEKGLQYLLRRQQPFGGWFDPEQPYENFRTPFRETQFAVLALSEFYKGPGAKGWQNGLSPQPRRLSLSEPLALLDELDNIWDPPSEELLAGMMAAASSQDALIRQAAITALGRVADPSAVGILKTALGDPNKMVQRSAAWALRQTASRKNRGFPEIQAALQDGNDRVRLGASRIFWTHFAYLADRGELADALLKLASDPVPTIRMNALKGLWQWWYWTGDQTLRAKIEECFLTGMKEEQHPWVARNLGEGLYNIADDNIRYLYNNWVPLLGSEEDRDKAVLGRLEVEHQLATEIAAVLEQGPDSQKKTLLEALTQFHLRSPKSYDVNENLPTTEGSLYVRIGNDAEQTAFFGHSMETLVRVLRPLLCSPDPDMRRLATQASFTVREIKPAVSYSSKQGYGFGDVLRLAETHRYEATRELLAWDVLKNLMDPVEEVRGISLEVYKSFTLSTVGEKQGASVAILRDLLSSPFKEARLGAFEVIRLSGDSLSDRTDLAGDVRRFALDAEPQFQRSALAAIKPFPALHQDARILAQLRKSLSSDDLELFRAGAELSLQLPALQQNGEIQAQLEQALGPKDPKVIKVFMDILNVNRSLARTSRGTALLSEALVNPDASIVQSALGIVRQEPDLQKNPAVLAALNETRKNPRLTPMERYLADNLYYGQKPSGSGGARPEAVPTRRLDYGFFAARVQPILQARGKDGNACVRCHATHTLFKLNPPPLQGEYREEQIQENYHSALKVINWREPENSLILRKPTSDAEVEGALGANKLSHGGGVRWELNSPEYRTILAWINGVSLNSE